MTYQPTHTMNHIIHKDPAHRHGCHNSPRPRHESKPYEIQDGWNEDGTRRMVSHQTEWKPVPCGHTWSDTDPACEGCEWRDA